MDQKKDNSIGALWLKQDKNGNGYLSGYVEIEGTKYHITAFQNKYYEAGGNRPQYNILPSLKREK